VSGRKNYRPQQGRRPPAQLGVDVGGDVVIDGQLLQRKAVQSLKIFRRRLGKGEVIALKIQCNGEAEHRSGDAPIAAMTSIQRSTEQFVSGHVLVLAHEADDGHKSPESGRKTGWRATPQGLAHAGWPGLHIEAKMHEHGQGDAFETKADTGGVGYASALYLYAPKAWPNWS